MKVLTFTIDPAVHFSARESVSPTPLNLLPLCWTARLNENLQARSSDDHVAACPRQFPQIRNLLQARLSCDTHAIRRTNQRSYKNHSISTTQNGNGTWIAAFGRRHGDAVHERGRAAILETRPQLAEVIALADAQIEIDDWLTGKSR